MAYTVNKLKKGKTFEIPTDIVDKHIRLATGDQIKVLLLLMRLQPQELEAKEIATKLKMKRDDVDDCLQYWILTGVVSDGSGSEDETESEVSKPEKYIPRNTGKKKADTVSVSVSEAEPIIEYSRPTQSEIASRISESKEIATLFQMVQAKMGKTIGYDGQATLLLVHDRFGLPVDVIYMLIEYCVSIGKTGFGYIESVGQSWGEQEIDSIEKAAEKIESLNKADSFWKKFIVETGIKTPKPTSKQIEYIEHWTKDLGMSMDMIVRAYEQMADNTGKISFAYMNKILEGWNVEGFRKISDVENAKNVKQAAKQKPGVGSASYDIDDFVEKSKHSKLKYARKNR